MHMYGSVVTVNASAGDVRLYYACNVGEQKTPGQPDSPSALCVAVSDDGGVSFTKPLLPYVPFENWTHTNMLFRSASGWFDSVMVLPEGMPAPAGAPAGTRFLMAFDDGTTDTEERAMQLAVSADGYVFTVLHPAPRLPASFADTSVSVSFDPQTQTFVALGRLDGAPNQHPGVVCGDFPPPDNWNMRSVRAVRRAVSPPTAAGPSLLNFSVPADGTAFSFDRLDVQCLDVYNTAASVVSSALVERWSAAAPAMERAYVAFPSVYLHYGTEENNGIVDVRFAFSRNATAFRYIGNDRRAYVPRGIAAPVSLAAIGLQPSLFTLPDDGVPAAWDSGLTYMYRGVVNHANDGMQSLYYFGQQGSHAHQGASDRGQFGIGRLTMVRDRWVSLGADAPTPGPATNGSTAPLHMTTRPVLLPQCHGVSVSGGFSGNTTPTLTLTLNAEVSVGGNLSVALLDATTGAPLQGYSHGDCQPIVGNRLAAPLRFQRGPNATVYVSDLGPVASKAAALQLDLLVVPPARLFAWRFHCGAAEAA